MKLRAEVFRWSLGDCTNSGLSSSANTVLVVTKDEIPNLSDEERKIAVTLEQRTADYFCLRPVDPPRKGMSGYMSGGNFVYTCDSRWSYLTGGIPYPLSLHDRTEEM
jgi:hypothetical protein